MSMPPAAKPGSLVLVTGANGYIAGCIVEKLLKGAYRVRGTVRSLDSASYLKKSLAVYGDRFEVVEVPKISDAGAFDNALKGVDAVIHAASPVKMDAKHLDDHWIPTYEGTMSLLRSAAKVPSVKRVIYLGTTGSLILGAKDPEKEVLDASDWNLESAEGVKDPSSPAFAFHVYCHSKTAAEKAGFNFVEKEKPGFSFSSVLCSVIIGPVHKRELTEQPPQYMSLGMIYDIFADPPRIEALSPVVSIVWVSSHDVATLFEASLTSDYTPGKRLIAHAGLYSKAQVADIVRREFPERPFPPVREDAMTMMYRGATHVRFDTHLEEVLLGGKWRSLDSTILECARGLIALEKKGWHQD